MPTGRPPPKSKVGIADRLGPIHTRPTNHHPPIEEGAQCVPSLLTTLRATPHVGPVHSKPLNFAPSTTRLHFPPRPQTPKNEPTELCNRKSPPRPLEVSLLSSPRRSVRSLRRRPTSSTRLRLVCLCAVKLPPLSPCRNLPVLVLSPPVPLPKAAWTPLLPRTTILPKLP